MIHTWYSKLREGVLNTSGQTGVWSSGGATRTTTQRLATATARVAGMAIFVIGVADMAMTTQGMVTTDFVPSVNRVVVGAADNLQPAVLRAIERWRLDEPRRVAAARSLFGERADEDPYIDVPLDDA